MFYYDIYQSLSITWKFSQNYDNHRKSSEFQISVWETPRFHTQPTDPVCGFGQVISTLPASFTHVEIVTAVTKAIVRAKGGRRCRGHTNIRGC